MEAISSILSPKPVRGPADVTASNIFATKANIRKDSGNQSVRAIKKDNKSPKEIKEASNEKINRISEAMDSYVRSVQRHLEIQVHSKTGKIIVKVISQDSGKVIREIPPKELLDLAAKMEEMTGTLLNENV